MAKSIKIMNIIPRGLLLLICFSMWDNNVSAQQIQKFVAAEYEKISKKYNSSLSMEYHVTMRYYLPDSAQPENTYSYSVALFNDDVHLKLNDYDRVYNVDYSLTADHLQKKVYVNEPDMNKTNHSNDQVKEVKELMKNAASIDTFTTGDVFTISFRLINSTYQSASISYHKQTYLIHQYAFEHTSGQKIVSVYSDYIVYPPKTKPLMYDPIVVKENRKKRKKNTISALALTQKYTDYELINLLK